MADQVTKGKGLSMPSNPARALQELMLAQMDAGEPPAVDAQPATDAAPTPTGLDSKTVRQISGKIESNLDSEIESNTGSKKDSQTDGNTEGKTASESAGKTTRRAGRSEGTPAASSAVAAKSRDRARAETLALDLAATPMKAVGLKMPEGLHDWLDDCQHRLKKQGVLKQDLLRRALQLLVVEVEGGEKLAEIER